MHAIVVATVSRLFDSEIDHETVLRAGSGGWPTALWDKLVELGLPLAFLAEEAGGIGLSSSQAFDIIRLGGAAALPLPLGETMIARWLAERLGIPAPEGVLVFATEAAGEGFTLSRDNGRATLKGRSSRVPAARHAEAILLQARTGTGGHPVWMMVPRSSFELKEGSNLAGEPRDDVSIDRQIDPLLQHGDLQIEQAEVMALGAAIRCASLAGAMEEILRITTLYANERVQFGKPIGRQQAIQHALAQLAGEAAAARASAVMAAAAIGRRQVEVLPIAAAKVRIGEAAGKAAAIAHQVHGAIGFTREHRLHDFTTRLWAWREEFGSERHWAKILGDAAIAAGAEGYWPFVTGLTESAGEDPAS